MQSVIINADDYAMDAGVDAGILHLASIGVISAASAMVLPARWPEAARVSRDAPPLSWGLHFDLTSPFVEGDFAGQKLSALMARAQAGLLDRERLRREANRQLSLFEAGRGAPPDFVDGHQHVHQLPAVREVLLEALEDRYGRAKERIGLRICASRRWRGVKAAIIGRTGANRLSSMAASRGHPLNSDFAGVYNFAADADLPAHWRAWAGSLRGPFPLIMCHVAVRSADFGSGDPIRQARWRELEWLASEEFLLLRQQFAIAAVRWPQA